MPPTESPQESLFPSPIPADTSELERAAAELQAAFQATAARIEALAAMAKDLAKAASEFQGASLSLDVRSPDLTTGKANARFEEMRVEGAFGKREAFALETERHYFVLGWASAATEPIPDGPELPQDAQEWAKVRRAVRLGRPLARLAREMAEGVEELRLEVKR